jgi:hypothetical protein
VKTIARIAFVLFLTLLPTSARADTVVTGTATLTVVVLPSPLDAAILPGCEFVVATSTETVSCNATLIVADPTLSLTGWRVTLAVLDLTCTCQQALSPDLLTVQAIAGPIFVNGQPIDRENGPVVESDSLGQSLKSPIAITSAQPSYGNGAYSYTLVIRLAVPNNTLPGTYVPEWTIGLSPRPN